MCVVNLLFQIVTLLLQSGLVFADSQQLRLSFLKAARQLVNNLQHDTFPWIKGGIKILQTHWLPLFVSVLTFWDLQEKYCNIKTIL